MTSNPTAGRSSGLTLGIDLGGTKMAAALVSATGDVLEQTAVPRADSADAMRRLPLDLAAEMLTPAVRAIGVGAAGLVRANDGVLVWGPNVEGREVPFKQLFEERFGLPTAVDNDASLSGLAEARIGAAMGYEHVLMLTLGTGIGGGWMIDGARYHGRAFAGEVGHMVVDVGGPRCTCGQNGCWEVFASGRRLDQLARDVVALRPTGLVAQLAAGETPNGRHLTDAALEGDSDARAALAEMAGWLGVGLANMIAVFDPEVIVIGGGVWRAGELLLAPAREAVERTLEGAEHREATPILGAALGEHAGVIGAGLVAREECL